jgi:hypothetical protein
MSSDGNDFTDTFGITDGNASSKARSVIYRQRYGYRISDRNVYAYSCGNFANSNGHGYFDRYRNADTYSRGDFADSNSYGNI